MGTCIQDAWASYVLFLLSLGFHGAASCGLRMFGGLVKSCALSFALLCFTFLSSDLRASYAST
jgi:hypothetical protein